MAGTIDVPKTAGSIRTVPLVPELASILRDQQERLAAKGLAVGESDWVFPASDGGLLPPCSLRHPMERALKLAGITKRVPPHGLRRTFNNEVRREACEIVARSITGHVTQAMTEHYSHVDRAEKMAAVANIARRISGVNGEFGGVSGVAKHQTPDPIGPKSLN